MVPPNYVCLDSVFLRVISAKVPEMGSELLFVLLYLYFFSSRSRCLCLSLPATHEDVKKDIFGRTTGRRRGDVTSENAVGKCLTIDVAVTSPVQLLLFSSRALEMVCCGSEAWEMT